MDPMLSSSTLLLLATVSGYGDVDAEGYPSWAEREIHLWTNAARVDPEAFESDYVLGGCSFSDFSRDEQTPKGLVYYHHGLNEAARGHSQDMEINAFFSHSSSDGTSFSDRVMAHYDEYAIGENIAWGYGDSRTAVLQGWMCSTGGHRENIMNGDWTEMGAGVSGDYYTQDFGGAQRTGPGPVASATHTPELPAREASFLVDWQEAEAPTEFAVVVDGTAHDLSLWYGEASQGIYGATLAWDGATACASYYFRWTDASGRQGTHPEEGSYLLGRDCGDLRMWEDSQSSAGEGGLSDWVAGEEADKGGSGCQSAGGSGLWGALLGLVTLYGRQRRRRWA